MKVDRSGLNEHHPIVEKLYASIDRVLKPIVAAEERRASAHILTAPRAVSARDQVGLRALNDLLKTAFEQPGRGGSDPGGTPSPKAPTSELEQLDPEDQRQGVANEPDLTEPANSERPTEELRFKQSPVRLHPGEKRTVTLLANPATVAPGTPVEIQADPGVTVTLRQTEIPDPGSRGVSTIQMTIRARVTVEPGSRLTVLAAVGEQTAELELIIVRHRASGWVREIARKNEDQSIEAEFDPETGIVTVYEGRREFRELERAANRSGLTKKRAPEYVPFRMLEVEAAANAVYHWAASQVVAQRLPEERPTDPGEYSAAVQHEAQMLRHRSHHKLMQAFLEPEIFDGAVTVERGRRTAPSRQLSLVDD